MPNVHAYCQIYSHRPAHGSSRHSSCVQIDSSQANHRMRCVLCGMLPHHRAHGALLGCNSMVRNHDTGKIPDVMSGL